MENYLEGTNKQLGNVVRQKKNANVLKKESF